MSGLAYTYEMLDVPSVKNEGDEASVVLTSMSATGQDADVLLAVADKETIHFSDGRRRIDHILAYVDDSHRRSHQQLCDKRKAFETQLEKNGLQLELEDKQYSQDGKTYFLKVHAPFDALIKWAEILNMKMPIKKNDLIKNDEACCSPEGSMGCLLQPLQLEKQLMPSGKAYFTAPFRASRMSQFVISSEDEFFSNSQRSCIVYEILSQSFMMDSTTKLGLKKLLAEGVYSAAFPLHEGSCNILSTSKDGAAYEKSNNLRQVLYDEWAKPTRFYKMQPLEAIRKYFGEKIGIYFAWLGFYTAMLVPASAVGLAVFIYGLATMHLDQSADFICSSNITMCPRCDKLCDCWKLEESCTYARLSYVFDNPATVIFAIFMSLWATFFIEFWKRKQARISYDWDVSDFEDEEEIVRPEYEAKLTSKTVYKNPVTQKDEVALPFWDKALRMLCSCVVILFMISLVVGAVFGVIVYRLVIIGPLKNASNPLISDYASLIRSITASIISLIAIVALNMLYEKVGKFLTDLEMHRTKTQWEDSFTFKIFLFQCVNYYSTIFYIAFFKGRFSGSPQEYSYVFGDYREEECDPAGCLIELSMQLMVVMVGKQAFNNAKEIIMPFLFVRLKKLRGREKKETESDKYTRWEMDYDLLPMPEKGLLDEYLEMVIQFGFVTFFVAAFPLAPLFALFNNLIEVRLDALKLVTQWRRPLALRAQDIGVWQWTLSAVAKVAVLTNGFIIALTSDFVNKLVYRVTVQETDIFNINGLEGYVEWSLSSFNTSDFSLRTYPPNKAAFLDSCKSTCSYKDFREGPGSEHKYQVTTNYWHVLAARLAFVIVFEHLVLLSTWLLGFIIPDMPDDVKYQELREKHLTKEAAIEAELMQTRAELAACASQLTYMESRADNLAVPSQQSSLHTNVAFQPASADSKKQTQF